MRFIIGKELFGCFCIDFEWLSDITLGFGRGSSGWRESRRYLLGVCCNIWDYSIIRYNCFDNFLDGLLVLFVENGSRKILRDTKEGTSCGISNDHRDKKMCSGGYSPIHIECGREKYDDWHSEEWEILEILHIFLEGWRTCHVTHIWIHRYVPEWKECWHDGQNTIGILLS